MNGRSRTWRTLRSRKLAAAFIFLLALLCAVGTVVPQRGEKSYGEWRRGSPRLAALAGYLGVDEVFTSVPFVVLLAGVALSTIACAAARLPGLARSGPGAPLTAHLLRRHRLLGSLAFHVGVLATLTGAALSAFTRSEGKVTVTEGDALPLARAGSPTGAWPQAGAAGAELFQIRLDRFHQVLHTRWGLPDYASDVTVLDDGREAKKATVRVNQPLSYRGLLFSQGVHGFAPWFMFAEQKSGKVFKSFVRLQSDLDSDPVRYAGSFAVPGTDYSVDAEFFPDAVLDEGVLRGKSPEPKNPAASVTVRRGGKVVYSGPVFRARPVEFEKGVCIGLGAPRYWSEFTVVKDSGVNVLFVGAWIAVAGLCLRFLPRRRRAGDAGDAGERDG